MTLLKEYVATSPDRPIEPAQGPDWQALYDAMLSQLMGSVETMVRHALEVHARQHGLLAASESSAPADQGERPRTTGSAGLDPLNAQLHKAIPDLVAPAAVPPPPWLRPFTLPENVRFTRTPDPVMRWERALPATEDLALKAREAARLAAEEAARIAQDELDRMRAQAPDAAPIWRKPFSLPPNVRYTRTPDVKITKRDPAVADLADTPDGPSLSALRFPSVTSTTDMRETASTNESQDAAFRAVTFTKTVTTVESVSVSTVEPAADELVVIGEAADGQGGLTGPRTPLSAGETPPEPGSAMETDAPTGFSAALRPTQWSELGLPAWFGIIRQSTEIALPWAVEQENVSPVGLLAGASKVSGNADADADADGSAALWRRSSWLEPGEPAETVAAVATTADLADADAEGSAVLRRDAFLPDLVVNALPGGGPVVHGATPVPMASRSKPGAPPSDAAKASERRAFASHGIAAFAGTLHVEGGPELYEQPAIDLLVMPPAQDGPGLTREALEQNARLLEGVLEDFGVRGEIIAVRPGPVVTLYELEPAPGVKSSRVVGLADDIARSMSAVSARVAVVQGRNVIGIELPNDRRETVFLRELVGSDEFEDSGHRLAIALGKTIGGEPVIVDLARMPHLLVAGTTGSGKSVAINTMILSLLYRMKPEECRLIMVDPKMLELSIYDGIPHLLTPVVTDPKKAVIALKWAVREMEDRYKKMSKVGVRNIDGFNARVTDAAKRGEVITRTVQQGFDRETGEPVYETEEMDLSRLPYIVIIVDEMADLMMVAGKEIEGAIQRLAQMARAAGIHLIMATQRPSVDVITGTIKANFPTRISFQVTSKIDSRTILGEQGAEQLLGQGDMLHMAGGGRIARVHGPFVSDGEVENVVLHLKAQGRPDYLDVVTADDEEPDLDDEATPDGTVFDRGTLGEDGADLYDQAVKVVLRDKKCSTSYIQRRLQVGYNKAASLVERMEKEGLVGAANHAGKREILSYSRDYQRTIIMPGDQD